MEPALPRWACLARVLRDGRAAQRPALPFLVAITGTAPAHSQSKTETAVVVVPDGETELQSVSSGRDLNTPTSRRTRRVLLPRTVDAPARRLDKGAAAVVMCRPAVDCSTTELPGHERPGQDSNLRPFA